jgi:protein-disulfide isomerase
MIVLSLLAAAKQDLRARLGPYLLILSLAAFGFSLFLAGISLFVLSAFCLFCISLYIVNALLLAVVLPQSGSALRALPGQLGPDLRALLRPAPLLLVAGGLCGGIASSFVLRAAGQEAHRSAEQRKQSDVASAGPQTPAIARIDLFDASAPSLGPSDAPVTIVEISDFECPYCQKASQTLAELRRLYPSQVRLVFRHFPLDQSCNPLLKRQIHANACAAARAAFCAGEQGQFWAYAEKLFAGATEPEDLDAHLRALQLKEPAFRRCLADPATAARIAHDIDQCAKAGVTGVPVLLINGRKLAGAQPIEAFRALIDEELAIAGKKVR